MADNTQIVATSSESPAPAVAAAPAPSTYGLNPNQAAAVSTAVTQEAAQAKGQTGVQINAGITQLLESQFANLFTPGELQAGQAGSQITGTGIWNSTVTPTAAWIQNEETAIGAYMAQEAAVAPPGPAPVVASSPTPLVPIAPPTTPTPPDPNQTLTPTPTTSTTTTSPGSTSTTTTSPSTSTTPDPNSIAGLLATLLPVLSGASGGGSATGTGTTGAGDLSGTNQPISSLGALQPIATPTSTTSTGAPGMLVAVIAIAAIGVGFWLFERHKKKSSPPK